MRSLSKKICLYCYVFTKSSPYEVQEESIPDWLNREQRIEEWDDKLEELKIDNNAVHDKTSRTTTKTANSTRPTWICSRWACLKTILRLI